MRRAVIVSKAVLTVMGTWLVLVLVIALPALLPERWEYYMISPASVVLWMLSMLVGPVVVCWKLRSWIRTVPGDPPRPDS
ncbi:hypothetical protein [Streptomyces triticiradicis]|uniref:Uncharacterized protein n=1 Tax=Streptomyces triticiradicis TaxID=2651189 RepID=A0A7J5DMH3_9ACTN|nr:hypothetical protein [Streptomyces triticiradicis]KAB1989908.1 hypothetical protein F8144_06095 [Streptomyces triticiradicis]